MNKPHLCYREGRWICKSHRDAMTGFTGKTPLEAYASYRSYFNNKWVQLHFPRKDNGERSGSVW